MDGTTTSYTYDKLGRLKTQTEDCFDIVTTYYYGFKWAGQNVNYVGEETTYPYTDSRSQLRRLRSRQYMDGLGRNIVNVGRNTGPSSNDDILVGTDYDKYGRVARTYAPYARANNYGNYRANSTTRLHTLHRYESSPLSREVETTPPGWYATKYSFGSNIANDKVKKEGGNQLYSSGTLFKQVVTDPNGNKSIKFIDKLGQLVLSRRTDGAESEAAHLDTYYNYDGRNRLVKVIPPGSTPTDDELTFRYVYDDEDRVSVEYIPGKKPKKYYYNSKDLLGAYQDGNLTSIGKHYAYNYDGLGRIITEGLTTTSAPTSSFSNMYISQPLIKTVYGSNSYDKDKISTLETLILGTNSWLKSTNIYSNCGRLLTQTENNHVNVRPYVLGTSNYSYDAAGNLLELVYNHNGFNPEETLAITSEHSYDIAGRNIQNWFKVGTDDKDRVEINHLSYNERNQIKTKFQGGTKLSGTKNYLQKIDYTYLDNGMLEGINIDGLTGSSQGINTALYYSSLPEPGMPSTSTHDQKDLFYEYLYRDIKPSVSGSSAPIRKNGDISYVAHQVRGRQQLLWGTSYDTYDRMVKSDLYERSTPSSTAYRRSQFSERVQYDERGNINSLTRYGVLKLSSSTKWLGKKIDELDYMFNGNSNQLLAIDDLSYNKLGYSESTNGEAYEYDDNGNMTYDPAKKLTITYNHLDLPTNFEWKNDGDRSQVMKYDASGTLLSRTIISASGTKVESRDYIKGVEYITRLAGSTWWGTLKAINHAEGRVTFESGKQHYQYILKDHLGNNRLLYEDINNNGIPEVPNEIVQEDHYYPFGMAMSGPWMSIAGKDGSAYRYNGKELNEDLGLYDYGARWYDPAVARFTTIDPLASEMPSWSPYNYTFNNPIKLVDPDGRAPQSCCGSDPPISAAGILYEAWQNGKAAAFNMLQRFGEGQRLSGGSVTRMRVNYNADGTIPTNNPTTIVTEQPQGVAGETFDATMDVLALSPLGELAGSRGMSGPFLAARAGGNPVASVGNFLKRVDGVDFHTASAGDFNLMHSEEMITSGAGYQDIKNLTDEQLINAATSPADGSYITVSGNSGSLINGNTRIYELQRRGLNDVPVSFTTTPNTNAGIFPDLH